jgi:hypothetical protein
MQHTGIYFPPHRKLQVYYEDQSINVVWIIFVVGCGDHMKHISRSRGQSSELLNAKARVIVVP